ncbi:MAG: response regulator, partial [Alphaproteobacteria bacterium]|nr:response regulator [Alphaproteobacteria bacterium]
TVKNANVSEHKVRLQFSVEDTGIGITADQQKILFKSFQQADSSTSRQYGGSGLGLAISKNLVELMGGVVWMESEVGRGSSFHFTLDLQVGKQNTEPKSKNTSILVGKSVLLVGDVAISNRILAEYLTNFGMKTTIVADGFQAIDKLASWSKNYDFLIIDESATTLSGEETLSAIGAEQKIHKIPSTILLSSEPDREDLSELEIAGKIELLQKPVSPSGLLDCLHIALRNGNSGTKFAADDANFPHESLVSEGGILESEVFDLNAKILLVEDNIVNQELAIEILIEAGCQVKTAMNGEEAIQTLQVEEFDLILMDIQMPGIDGYETTRRIRAFDKFADLPIIAMTANAMLQDRKLALEAGMNDYVTKPFERGFLLKTIAIWTDPTVSIWGGSQLSMGSSYGSAEAKVVAEPDLALMPQQNSIVIAGLDTAGALNRLGGKETIYKKALIGFNDSTEKSTDLLNDLYEKGDMKNLSIEVHTLKGLAATVGANDLHTHLKELEVEVKTDGDNIAAAIKTVQKSFQKTREAIEEAKTRGVI